jgi:hypothetical protein
MSTKAKSDNKKAAKPEEEKKEVAFVPDNTPVG